MSQMEVTVAQSVEEAISLLAQKGDGARVIAGGTDLLVRMKKGEVVADRLINIGQVSELDYVSYRGDKGLRIGALTSIQTITKDQVIRVHLPALSEAAALLGTPTIRRQATIGGNLCNAAPSADMAPPLLLSEAEARMRSLSGERLIPLQDFFLGPGQTDVRQGELLTEILVPELPSGSRTVYLKHTRTRGADLAIVGVATMVQMDGRIVKDARIALGAVAPVPMRAAEAEKSLVGRELDDRLLDETAEIASSEARPIDDVRGSASYRRQLVRVLVKRALKMTTEKN